MRHHTRPTAKGEYDGSSSRHKPKLEEPLLLPGDAARILGVTPATVVNAAKDGRLPIAAKTVSGVRLFTRAAVEQFKKDREERGERLAAGAR